MLRIPRFSRGRLCRPIAPAFSSARSAPKLGRLGRVCSEFLLRTKLTSEVHKAESGGRLLAAGTYGLILVTGLGTIGVDTSPLLASLGATGFTLGFALKDTASNAFAGLALYVQKPFEIGDTVVVAKTWRGRVVGMDYRYVHLSLLGEDEGKRASIPSSLVYDHAVVVEPRDK